MCIVQMFNGIWRLVQKCRYFVFPKKFLCFRVRVRVRLELELGLGLELAKIPLNTFSAKRPFRQVY